jgi:hypothetical protein
MSDQQWTDTNITRPSANNFTPEQFRKLFDVSDDVIDHLVRENVIPPPARFNSRAVFFTWKHAALLMMRMEMGLQLPPSSGKPEK